MRRPGEDRQAAHVEERQRQSQRSPGSTPRPSARAARARLRGSRTSAPPASARRWCRSRDDRGPRRGRPPPRASTSASGRRRGRHHEPVERAGARGSSGASGAEQRQRVEQLAKSSPARSVVATASPARHPERGEAACARAAASCELGVRQDAPLGHQGRMVGAGARSGGQPLVQRIYRTAASRRGLDRAADGARSAPPPTGSPPATTRTSATRRRTGSPRSRSTAPRCATPSGRRR